MSVRPTDDIAALWPDMNLNDFSLYLFTLSAVSTGQVASGYFDYLRFTRSTGEVQLQTQRDLETAYALRYPSVTQRQGLEVSFFNPHVNWFGGAVAPPDYAGISTATQYKAWLQQSLVPQIHAAGGLVSYNHRSGQAGGRCSHRRRRIRCCRPPCRPC